MTNERYPARKAGTMVCGHPTACMYRWRDAEKNVHKYCMACLLIKSGIPTVDEMTEDYKKQYGIEEEIMDEPVVESKTNIVASDEEKEEEVLDENI